MKHNSDRFQSPSTMNENERFGALQDARAQATSLFWNAYYGEKWNRLWSWLAQRDNHLQTLIRESESTPVTARHYSGIRTVSLKEINCSEGRSKDFDAKFRPARSHNKDRWVGVAAAREAGKSLPPVDLIQVGDSYCVRDRHHRISVARVFGQQEIDAEVTVWEAELAKETVD
jgi:hypothetical protein